MQAENKRIFITDGCRLHSLSRASDHSSAGRRSEEMPLTWGKTRISMLCADITDQDVDAIVNAANSSLMGGGGVDGAIHRRGGPQVLEECRRIRTKDWPDGLPSGQAVVTGGGLLKARHVIHTVGPVWRGGGQGESKVLAECYANSLSLAKRLGFESVAFPSISTGAYGYPIEQASRVALSAVKEFVEKEGCPTEIVFVLFSRHDLAVYTSASEALASRREVISREERPGDEES